jgi:hypothetical protein
MPNSKFYGNTSSDFAKSKYVSVLEGKTFKI